MMNENGNETLLQKLQSLSEKDLQTKIIEPLLRAEGFEAVRDVSGPNEKGKDIIAVRHEFGASFLYAIQVKKTVVTGKIGSADSLQYLMIQLKQAIQEKIFDPSSQTERKPHRLVFITPFPIHRATFESALYAYGNLTENQIQIVDGEALADRVIKLIPEALSALDDRLSFDAQFLRVCDTIREKSAFGYNAPESYSSIFINIDVDCFQEARRMMNSVLGAKMRFDEELERDYLYGGRRLAKPVVSDDTQRKVQSLWERYNGTLVDDDLNSNGIDGLFLGLCSEINRITTLFDRFKDTANGSASRAKVFSSVKKLQDFITELTAIPDLKNAWVLMTESTMARLKEFVASRLGNRSLRADTLQYCQTPLLVTGPPGSGKTTLLHQTAKHMMMTNVKRVTPVVLLRAADMKIFSSSRILSDALFRLGELGRPVAKEDFRNALREGEVRIFVDGLDEAGEKMHLLTAAIVDICREFPRLMVVASVRDSVAGFDWKEALRIRLQKFDAEQLNSFIWKWFAADPTRATTLCSWIQANDTLGAIARTPVNAALLCSLTDVLGKLPTTELDLYRSRLNLLLGGWEEAKNIAPMPREIRRQYELFLKTLAFEAHKRNERNFLRSLAISIAPRYMTPGYNKDANSMIDDLIRRGVLEVQVDGRLSFGHLTFQEHLAAEYMYQYRPIAFIHEHISSGWWLKPLIFLSTMMEDIGDILSSLADSSILSAKTQINTLLGYAVHTRTHPWLDRKLKLLAL